MKIGITGTRSGMNDRQRNDVINFFKDAFSQNIQIDEFHHGDCIGVDVQVAEIASTLGIKVVCHPPVKTELRAYHRSDVILEPFGYFERNRHIVDATDALIVIPWQNEWSSSGGTWYTHDYAIKKGKPVRIFFPDA